MVILGAMFTFLAIAYSTTRAATQGSSIGTQTGNIQLSDAEQGEDHSLITTEPSERRQMRTEALRAAVEAGCELSTPNKLVFFRETNLSLDRCRPPHWKNLTTRTVSTKDFPRTATETTNVDLCNINTRPSTLSSSWRHAIPRAC